MELDPKLAAMVAATIAPTKLLIDFVAAQHDIKPTIKLMMGFLIALTFICLFQGYMMDVAAIPTVKLICGNVLAAFSALQGAVLLTEVQKRVDRKKRQE